MWKNNSTKLTFIVLALTSFWGMFGYTKVVLSYPLLIFVVLCLQKRSIFKWNIIIFFLFLFLNIYICDVYRGQSFLESFDVPVYRNFFPILIYFYLIWTRYGIENIEKAILNLTIIFSICYIFQYIIYPTQIFYLLAAIEDEHRFRLVGQGIVSLGFFFCLNKYLLTNHKKYIPIIILCFFILFSLGFRSMSLAIIFTALILIIRIYGVSKRFILLSIILSIFLVIAIQIPFVSEIIDKMMQRQETDNMGNEDYVRVLQLDYFLHHHFKNIIEFIGGSGVPNPNSGYGKYMYSFNEVDEYGVMSGTSITGWFDWGLIGLSWVMGIPAVLALLIYAIRAIILKVDKEYYYIGCWFLFLLIISPVNTEFYREGIFVFHGIALYLVEKAHIIYRNKKVS